MSDLERADLFALGAPMLREPYFYRVRHLDAAFIPGVYRVQVRARSRFGSVAVFGAECQFDLENYPKSDPLDLLLAASQMAYALAYTANREADRRAAVDKYLGDHSWL